MAALPPQSAVHPALPGSLTPHPLSTLTCSEFRLQDTQSLPRHLQRQEAYRAGDSVHGSRPVESDLCRGIIGREDLNLLSMLTIPKNVTLCDWKAGVYRIEEGAANVTSWSVDVIASAAVAST